MSIQMYNPTRHYKKNKTEYDQRINSILGHGFFINGPEVKELENRLCEYVKVENAIGVSSGTDALLISLMAIGLEKEDEVVTVPFTWISTAEVIKLVGAKPVFCDIEEKTFNMDPMSLKEVITEKTKVVMPVSMFGQLYDHEKIQKVVNEAEEKYKHKIYIVEDAAQSFGATDVKMRKSCSLADVSCTSFFPSKPLGCFGDGGMCFTNNDELAKKIRMIRSHGCIKRYEYECVGMNGRLDTIQAGILLAKLGDFEESLAKRIENAKYYNRMFSNLPVEVPTQANYSKRHVYAQYTLTFRDSETCEKLQEHLKNKNIGCGKFYPVCLHLVKVITDEYEENSLPVSEYISSRVLSLPVYPELEKEERECIAKEVINFFTEG